MSNGKDESIPQDQDSDANVNKISIFRRCVPQVLVTMVKNLIIFNKSLFDACPSIIIPSLLGISTALNPNETIRITSIEASWLASLGTIGHPFGSLASGFVSDSIGRRRAMMLVAVPAILGFISLAFAESFTAICIAFTLLSFVFGLKDAPTTVYISETSEPSIRGTMLSFAPISHAFGYFVLNLLGSSLSWRQVVLICSLIPAVIVVALFLIPESPNWLLSKDRPKDAQKSLQWLRGWVKPEAVQDEFTRLQKHSAFSTACVSCAKQSIACDHPKATFCDKAKELKRKRTLKPLILVLALDILMELSAFAVWGPYIIQIVKAHGVPLNANVMATILSFVRLIASVCFLLSVNLLGKRRLYMSSTSVFVLCSLGLSIYGFVFFPPNWTSFRNPSDSSIPNFDLIREVVGNYGYIAVVLLLIMQFGANVGLSALPHLIQAEVFSFKLRSFLCGTTLALRSALASVAKKTYYEIEVWLTLPGAVLFYGTISFVGLIVMYFILPETEHRSLEDIERHYADNSKKITDINISYE